MKTKVLLTIGAVLLAAATYNLNADTGATFLTKHNPTNAALLTPRAVGNVSKIVVASGADNTKGTKCPLIGTPRSIEAASKKARMACCNMMLADCSTTAMCGK